MAFPSNPDNGEQYLIDDVTWEYVSSKGCWDLVNYQRNRGIAVSVFTSSGTWTKPTNASMVNVTVVGGGQGGGTGFLLNPTDATGGSGGIGGGMSVTSYRATDLGSTQSVTVGTGGISTGSGGNSSFASIKAYGGGVGFTGFGDAMFKGSTPGTGGTGGDSNFGHLDGNAGATPSSSTYPNGGAGGGNGATGVGTFESGAGGVGGATVYGTPTSLVDLPALGTAGSNAGYGFGGNGGIGDAPNTITASGTNGGQGVVVVVTWFSA